MQYYFILKKKWENTHEGDKVTFMKKKYTGEVKIY